TAYNNLIGGLTVGVRNVISGNYPGDIILVGASSNIVQGNFIGTDVKGSSVLATSGAGVYLAEASFNLLGGTNSAAGNLISGHAGDGIDFFGASTNNVVQGNFIGTDLTGM